MVADGLRLPVSGCGGNDMALITLENGPFSVVVSPLGGAIWSFRMRHQGRVLPLLQSRGEAGRDGASLSGCFPLVPFGNRVRGNRFSVEGRDYCLLPNTGNDPFYLHGDGWLGQWQLEHSSKQCCMLSFEKEADAISPYAYRARQEIALDERGLSLSLEVTNRGASTLPFGLGWHPFFPLTPTTTLYAPASDYWTEDEQMLPAERSALSEALDFNRARPLPACWVNNGFEGWTGEAEIVWPEDDLTLRIRASELFGRYQIFVSDRSFDPGYRRDFFCFEPMSHSVDAHHWPDGGGLRMLRPAESLAGHMRLEPKIGAR